MSLSRLLPKSGLVLLSSVMLLLCGCGGSQEPAESETSLLESSDGDDFSLQSEDEQAARLPAASIGGGAEIAQEPAPDPSSPAGIIAQIKELRSQPFPTEISGDVEKLKKARAERNRRMTQLATEAVALTHHDPAQEAAFTEAVHLLMESRLQLALQGDQESIGALYDDASSLYKRNPDSAAAADAAYVLVRFAHTNARRFAQEEPRWLEEFARQARIFATSFPSEESRAVSLLHAAGWSCELHRMNEEAIECYTVLKERFPETPQGRQVDALLRRLTLRGKPLQLAGPTLDGGYVSVDEFQGQHVLIIFWASDADRFVDLVPELNSVIVKYESAGLRTIGVNLDAEESEVEAFLSEHKLDWPQIFYADPAKRRWESPIARYYGIRDIPMAWIVDPQGVVLEAQLDVSDLDAQIGALLSSQPTASR